MAFCSSSTSLLASRAVAGSCFVLWRGRHKISGGAHTVFARNPTGTQFAASGVTVDSGEPLMQMFCFSPLLFGHLTRRIECATLPVRRFPAAVCGVFGYRRMS